MKRSTLALLVVAALAVGTAQPALAATKKPIVKPITKTYYFHGATGQGDVDQNGPTAALMTMDKTKPSSASDKEFVIYGAATSPNTACAGSALFPNWVGSASGSITGTMTVSFYARSTPSATAVVQVFADVTEQACNADEPASIGEAVVPLKTGAGYALHTVKIPVSKVAKVFGSITVQIMPGSTAVLVGPQISDVAYDSTASPSAITFTCLPAKGKKTC